MEGNEKGNCQRRPTKTSTFQVPCFFVTSHLQGLVRSAIAAVTEYRPFQACYVFCDSSPVWNYSCVQFLSGYPACNLWAPSLFSRVKRPGRGTKHPPPSCTKFQSGYNYTCLPCVLSIVCSYSQDGGNNLHQNTMNVLIKKNRSLGRTLTNQNYFQEEIKSRLKSGNGCYYLEQHLSSSTLLSKILKIKIHRTTIFPFF
jgi:hypothetical protein